MQPTLHSSNGKIPPGATSLFFIQIFSTLSYSVLYVSLVLFAVQALGLQSDQANHIMATFIAFNFAIHFLTGAIGGRLLSFRALFLIGMILQTIGCLLIAKLTLPFFMLGMAIFLVGSGMDLPCINCMITQLFHPDDKRREYAFLWNYSGMNIGFFIGVTVAGLYQQQQHFSTLFIFAATTNVIALILMLAHWQKFHDKETALSPTFTSLFKRLFITITILIALILALTYILRNAFFSTEIIIALGVMMALVIAILIFTRKEKAEKNKLIAFAVFVCASLVFYTLYELIPMALTLFLERNVDRHFLGFTIPTAWFLNINTVIVIVGCPLIALLTKNLRKKGYPISVPLFFSIGLILIGIAIIVLPLGILEANASGLIAIGWPIITYVFLALAEICLSPIGYALVGELSPPNLRGILMGTWLLASGVSAILSNIFSNLALGEKKIIAPLISNPSYGKIFLYLGFSGIGAGLLLMCLKPLLERLMQTR